MFFFCDYTCTRFFQTLHLGVANSSYDFSFSLLPTVINSNSGRFCLAQKAKCSKWGSLSLSPLSLSLSLSRFLSVNISFIYIFLSICVSGLSSLCKSLFHFFFWLNSFHAFLTLFYTFIYICPHSTLLLNQFDSLSLLFHLHLCSSPPLYIVYDTFYISVWFSFHV